MTNLYRKVLSDYWHMTSYAKWNVFKWNLQ